MIARPEFESRLNNLLRTGLGSGIPKDWQDQLVLLGAALTAIPIGSEHSEAQINDLLREWLEAVFPQAVQVDHVKLRRYLVDAGLLERDPAGRRYRVARDSWKKRFSFSVWETDPRRLAADLAAERRRRREEWQKRSGRSE